MSEGDYPVSEPEAESEPWQAGLHSVNVPSLTVAEASDRLGAIQERLNDATSYEARDADAEQALDLRSHILGHATGSELAAELQAVRDRAPHAGVPSEVGPEPEWQSHLRIEFLHKATTSDLNAEAKAVADTGAADEGWRRAIGDEVHEHKLVDQVADTALEELRRWDTLSGSQADGKTLRHLADAAEKIGGSDGLAQFFSRLGASDHKAYDDQLTHFSAAVGRESATEYAAKMAGRGLDVGPTHSIGSFWGELGREFVSGEARDNMASYGGAMVRESFEDAQLARDLMVDAIEHPGRALHDAGESLLEAIVESPALVRDTVTSIPDMPDRFRSAMKAFDQAPEGDKARIIGEFFYGTMKDLVLDKGTDALIGHIVGAATHGAAHVAEDAHVGSAAAAEHVPVDHVPDRPPTPSVAHEPSPGAPAHGPEASAEAPPVTHDAPATEVPPPHGAETTAPTGPALEAPAETAIPAAPAAQVEPVASAPTITGEADGQTVLTAGTGGIEAIHRETIDNAHRTVIEGTIKEPIPRGSAPNFNDNQYWPAAKDLGLTDYHKAHLWGPGFGDEAYAGIAYVPKEFNLHWQNAGIESRIRELGDMARARGFEIHVTAEVQTHPRVVGGGEALKSVEYKVELGAPGVPADSRKLIYEVSVEVDAPPHGRVHSPTIHEGPASPISGDASWLDQPLIHDPAKAPTNGAPVHESGGEHHAPAAPPSPQTADGPQAGPGPAEASPSASATEAPATEATPAVPPEGVATAAQEPIATGETKELPQQPAPETLESTSVIGAIAVPVVVEQAITAVEKVLGIAPAEPNPDGPQPQDDPSHGLGEGNVGPDGQLILEPGVGVDGQSSGHAGPHDDSTMNPDVGPGHDPDQVTDQGDPHGPVGAAGGVAPGMDSTSHAGLGHGGVGDTPPIEHQTGSGPDTHAQDPSGYPGADPSHQAPDAPHDPIHDPSTPVHHPEPPVHDVLDPSGIHAPGDDGHAVDNNVLDPNVTQPHDPTDASAAGTGHDSPTGHDAPGHDQPDQGNQLDPGSAPHDAATEDVLDPSAAHQGSNGADGGLDPGSAALDHNIAPSAAEDQVGAGTAVDGGAADFSGADGGGGGDAGGGAGGGG